MPIFLHPKDHFFCLRDQKRSFCLKTSSKLARSFFQREYLFKSTPMHIHIWYPAGSPNEGSQNGGLPKQYRHGGLPKRHFAESPVPQMVLG
jgi:hypothetical protein